MGGAQETIQSINNLQLENNKPTSLTLSTRGEPEKPCNNNEQISNLEVHNPTNKVCSKMQTYEFNTICQQFDVICMQLYL